MAALGVGLARGLTAAQMGPALRDYRPQPHRCEVVRELDGVTYINDSKATNLDALAKALASETQPGHPDRRRQGQRFRVRHARAEWSARRRAGSC